MTASPSAYARFLQRWSGWVVAFFFLMLPLIGWGALQAIKANSNDVKRWLPDAYPETKSLEWYQATFGMGSDAGVVIVWPDCRVRRAEKPLAPGELPDANAAPRIEADPTIAKLVKLLREAKIDPDDPKSKPLLIRVTSGPETLSEMTQVPTPDNENVLGLSYEEATRRLDGSILGPDSVHGIVLDFETHKPARVARVEFGTLAEKQGLQAGDEIAAVNGVATPDAAAAKSELEKTYAAGDAGTLKLELVGGKSISWNWQGPRPGRLTAVIASLSEEASDQRNLEHSVGRIKAIAEKAGIAAEDLRLGGPPVDNVAIDTEGRKTLVRLAALSFGVGLVMCYVCLGNLKLTILVFFTSLFSEGTSLAMVWWTGGDVDAILMSLPTLVYLLTISGAIHIVNYYRDSLPEVGPQAAPALSVTKGFIPCILAAGTTAVGMGSLYASDLAPIRNFGVYSAIAVMTTLMWIFFFVPANLQIWPLREKRKPGVEHGAPRRVFAPFVRLASQTGHGILRARNWVAIAAVVTTVFFSFGIFGLNLRVGNQQVSVPSLRTSVKLMELFSDDTQIVHDYKWIENHLAQLVPMEVVIGTDNVETIVISGDPKGGSFVIDFTTIDGESGQTDSLPWNASVEDVQQALRGAGFQDALVQKSAGAGETHYRVMLDYDRRLQAAREQARNEKYPDRSLEDLLHGGQLTLNELIDDGYLPVGFGSLPVLNVTTEGDLTEDHVRVVHAPTMVERMWIVERAREKIVALQEVSSALATVTFGPHLPSTARGWNTEVSQVDEALNLSRPKLVESGFFAQQTGQDFFRLSLRIGAFSEVDYSHFVEDIRRAVDPIVYATVLEAHSAAKNAGRPLLGWEITQQIRDPHTGEAEFLFVHRAKNDDRADGVEFAGRVHAAADGALTAEIDAEPVFVGDTSSAGIRPTYTGIVPLVYKAQNELMRSLYTSYAWAFAMIVAVMIPPLWKMVGFVKSIPAAIFIMLPNFFPTAIVFGAMGMLRVPLDVGTMMTASVALGIALDDTVHYLAWFDRGVKEYGMSRPQACRFAYSCCARAMVQTTVVACIGMSVFMLSTFQPTMQFGLYMVPLMAVALFGDLVILPAMLCSPIGWLFIKSKPSKPATDDSPKSGDRVLEPMGTPMGPSSSRRPVGAARSRT